MSIRYEISTWSSLTATKAHRHAVKHRRDAALQELYSQLYQMIAGDGALDTKRGWRLVHEFEEFRKEVEGGLERGYYRSKTFHMTEGQSLGWHVEFRQERR